MITSEFPPKSGGIGYYVYNLSKKLAEKGHEITIITRGSGTKSARKVMDGMTVFQVSYFPLYPFHIWIHKIFIKMFFKKLFGDFDLVHIHSPLVPSIKTSLPIITTIHTPMRVDAKYHEVTDFYSLAERIQSGLLYPFFESQLLDVSKLITAVSPSVVEELKTYGLGSRKVNVVWNAVDENTFIPLLDKETGEKYVLYSGVLRARKGLLDLLECADYVCRARPNVRFVVCGTGPLLNKLYKERRIKELTKKVILLGHVERNRLIKLYQNATVYVVPSHYEGLPTVLLEAMSCGLPVVATDVGGNSEVILSGVNGFLVPPKAPKVMAENILRLIDDEKLRNEMGEEARKTVAERFTWNKIADNFLRQYERLLQGKNC